MVIHLHTKVLFMVFENYIKSLIRNCERSELPLQFELKMPKMVQFGELLKD